MDAVERKAIEYRKKKCILGDADDSKHRLPCLDVFVYDPATRNVSPKLLIASFSVG